MSEGGHIPPSPRTDVVIRLAYRRMPRQKLKRTCPYPPDDSMPLCRFPGAAGSSIVHLFNVLWCEDESIGDLAAHAPGGRELLDTQDVRDILGRVEGRQREVSGLALDRIPFRCGRWHWMPVSASPSNHPARMFWASTPIASQVVANPTTPGMPGNTIDHPSSSRDGIATNGYRAANALSRAT